MIRRLGWYRVTCRGQCCVSVACTVLETRSVAHQESFSGWSCYYSIKYRGQRRAWKGRARGRREDDNLGDEKKRRRRRKRPSSELGPSESVARAPVNFCGFFLQLHLPVSIANVTHDVVLLRTSCVEHEDGPCIRIVRSRAFTHAGSKAVYVPQQQQQNGGGRGSEKESEESKKKRKRPSGGVVGRGVTGGGRKKKNDEEGGRSEGGAEKRNCGDCEREYTRDEEPDVHSVSSSSVLSKSMNLPIMRNQPPRADPPPPLSLSPLLPS
ncbi:uncharacterized protein LOC143209641 [Lasioglossum baleicum]|uniref:uncharacterized protein LOC143209641 n=1 Tax=Lasioglossum baleicum TaxID=434251 RepID=UPI003FCCE9FB